MIFIKFLSKILFLVIPALTYSVDLQLHMIGQQSPQIFDLYKNLSAQNIFSIKHPLQSAGDIFCPKYFQYKEARGLIRKGRQLSLVWSVTVWILPPVSDRTFVRFRRINYRKFPAQPTTVRQERGLVFTVHPDSNQPSLIFPGLAISIEFWPGSSANRD